MGEIVIKVPGDIKEVIEISDPSVVQKILELRKHVPRKKWREKFKGENSLLVSDVFEDENLTWWEW